MAAMLGLIPWALAAQDPTDSQRETTDSQRETTDIEAVVQTSEGDIVEGRIISWNDEGLSIAAETGTSVLPLEAIRTISFPNASPENRATTPEDASTRIDLHDGSSIIAREFTFSQDECAATLEHEGESATISLQPDLVQSILFSEMTPEIEQEWNRILSLADASDLLVVRRESGIDYVEGILRGVIFDTDTAINGGADSQGRTTLQGRIGVNTNQLVEFEVGGDVLPVPRERLQGVVFHLAETPELAPPLGRLLDTHGSEYTLASFEIINGEFLLTTTGGLTLSLPGSAVLRIEFTKDDELSLTDIEPESVTWTSPWPVGQGFDPSASDSTFRLFHEPKTDRSHAGEQFQLGGATYESGLSLTPRTELTYRLPEGFRRLEGYVGLDDRVGDRGTVRLQIFGDDDPLFDETLTGDSSPTRLGIDIDGVRRLRIRLDSSDDSPIGDILLFCETRLLK